MSFRVVVPYDPAWVPAFEAERELLRRLLGPWLVADVEHVGSTAVPGMSAKPVLDMVAGVSDLEQARGAFQALETLDYRYRPHRPEAHLFDKPGVADWEEHTHHLHLTVPGSALWQERLAFRDALREDPALVAEYNAWKQQHAARAPGAGLAYDATKWPFVARVLQARGVTLRADAQRLVAEPVDPAAP